MRVAAIDLGTNSTRLLVADVADGTLTEVVRRLAITRMGESVDARRALLPAATARVHDLLDRFAREVEALGAERALAIATSAVRDAANGEAFLDEVARRHGFTTRLLSGDEEAELGFRGVTLGRVLTPGTLVVDIGGGSVELTVGGPDGIASRESTSLGCVRLTERFLRSDPPARGELEACRAHVRAALPPLEPATAIGVAGTVTTAASLDIGVEPYDAERVHGHRIPLTSVERHLEALAALSVAERARTPCLEPARAPVIVAGLVVLREILVAYGLDAVEASERDILHGTALAAAELPPRSPTPA
jgi:exopolyphosphatase/guanosine-5'-triphosphate,3'-diphosphate pyrophosphatase